MVKRKGKTRVSSEKQNEPAARKPPRWSQHVRETSNALDLEHNVFTRDSPKEIAASLKRSAEQSARRKAQPFQSAMSMLNFYINRAGRNLPSERKEILDQAKEELRALYQRPRRHSR